MSSRNAPADPPLAGGDPAGAWVLPVQLALGLAYPFLAHAAATHERDVLPAVDAVGHPEHALGLLDSRPVLGGGRDGLVGHLLRVAVHRRGDVDVEPVQRDGVHMLIDHPGANLDDVPHAAVGGDDPLVGAERLTVTQRRLDHL